MKKTELIELGVSELEIRLRDNLEALQNLRFQKALQQLENPIQIRRIKKEIAQLKTVLKEHELGLRSEKDGEK
ncbi:MAG: 50S ribosomal protein L29 [Fidelibacterota bacterium]